MWAITPMAADQSNESCRYQGRMAGMWVVLAEIHRRRGSIAVAEQLLVNAADADGEDLASYHLSYGLVQVEITVRLPDEQCYFVRLNGLMTLSDDGVSLVRLLFHRRSNRQHAWKGRGKSSPFLLILLPACWLILLPLPSIGHV